MNSNEEHGHLTSYHSGLSSSGDISLTANYGCLPADSQAKYVTSNIEDIRVGSWVLADNPEIDGEAESTQIIPERWRKLRLRMQKSGGGTLEIALLRSLEWIEATDARPGKNVYLDLAELGAEGDAEVVSIEPCPEIAPRPQDGCRIVTGPFAHSSAEVIGVSVDGLAEPIGVTSNHPFWSEDRQAFVEAGTLWTGEPVRRADDELLTVQSVVARKASEAVYNLEVDVEHVYYVSTSGVLVHNNCVGFPKRPRPNPVTTRPRTKPRFKPDKYTNVTGKPRTADQFLDDAELFLGKGYAEGPGGHLYSADWQRRVRFTAGDLTPGDHSPFAHGHFEFNGGRNIHIPLIP